MIDLILITLSRALVIVLQLFYVKLFSTNITANELSNFYFWTAVSYFFNALLFVPLNLYQQSKIHYWHENGYSLRVLLSLNVFPIGGTFIFVIIASILDLIFFQKWADWIFFAGLFSILLHIQDTFLHSLNLLGRKKIMVIGQIFDSLAKVLLFLVFMHYLEKIDGIILLKNNIITQLVLCISIFIIFHILGLFYGKYIAVSWKEVLEVSGPISIGAISNWIQLYSHRLLLIPLGHGELVAIYSLISSLGSRGMGTLNIIYSQFHLPQVYKSRGKELPEFLKKYVLLGIAALITGVLTGWFLTPIITRPEFSIYYHAVGAGIIIEWCSLTLGSFGILLSLYKQTQLGIIPGMASMFFSLCSMLLLNHLEKVTILNIGICLVISQIVSTMWNYKIYKNIYNTYINGFKQYQNTI